MSERACLVLMLVLLVAPVATAELVDPTRPPAVPGGAPDPAEPRRGLTSILVSPERRLATIDGETVRVGDRVQGGRVLAISPTTVRLAGPDGPLDLTLVPPVLRKWNLPEE